MPFGFRFMEKMERDATEERLSKISEQRKALEDRQEALSQANKFHYNKLVETQERLNEVLEARRREYQEHIDNGTIRTSAGSRARSRLFQVINSKKLLDKSGRQSDRDTLQKSFVDREFFGFNPISDIKTVFGTTAYVKTIVSPRQYFRSPEIARPCVERLVRKQVMFAKKHAGKAHRGRRRRNPLSQIWC